MISYFLDYVSNIKALYILNKEKISFYNIGKELVNVMLNGADLKHSRQVNKKNPVNVTFTSSKSTIETLEKIIKFV